MTEQRIRLLLADDQALVRGALSALLDLETDLTVVCEAGRGDEVVDGARRTSPAASIRAARRRPTLAVESLAAGTSPLITRETEVLLAAREGGTVADLAQGLHLSEGTVRNHLSSAIGKTRARTRAEAVRLADENGWLIG